MSTRTFSPMRPILAAAMSAGMLMMTAVAHAALFEDNEARRAILEVRQRVDAMQQSNQRAGERSGDDVSQLRRSLLDLQSQIETLRSEQSALRGQNEQLQKDVADLQRRQKEIAQGVDERLRKFEPITASVDGKEFKADPAEKRDFEAALAVFRSGKFPEAGTAFANFIRQYPQSGYVPSSRFWLGNSQYAARDYNNAITNFKMILTNNPDHARAPESALSIASCQVELKDTRAARKTLEDLIRVYPQSEAAAAAKERLARLK